jgi:predicted nuclease with TOPRIM domain
MRHHLEEALSDVMAQNTQLQETVEKHEVTIKQLQQRLDELEGNKQSL